MVYASDVRATLKLISRAEVSGGIIYATDAAIEPSVHVAYTFPAHSHDPIRYLVALINNAGQDTEDHAFYGFLSGSTAQGLFRKHGFLVRLMDSE